MHREPVGTKCQPIQYEHNVRFLQCRSKISSWDRDLIHYRHGRLIPETQSLGPSWSKHQAMETDLEALHNVATSRRSSISCSIRARLSVYSVFGLGLHSVGGCRVLCIWNKHTALPRLDLTHACYFTSRKALLDPMLKTMEEASQRGPRV